MGLHKKIINDTNNTNMEILIKIIHNTGWVSKKFFIDFIWHINTNPKVKIN